jgi:hypothetical protein
MVISSLFSAFGRSLFTSGDGVSDVPRSTVERTRLAEAAPGDVLTYEDATGAGGWFGGSVRDMQDGATTAYHLTGVKFGVYVTEGYYTDAELEHLADGVYEDWFGDSSAHLLIVLSDVGNGEFDGWDMIGTRAGLVFDREAMDIFWKYLYEYYNQPSNSEYQVFGKALESTAARIMTVTPTFGSRIAPFVGYALLIAAAGVGIFLYMKVSIKRKEAAAAKAKADSELLSTPVAGLDTPPEDPLLNKYN